LVDQYGVTYKGELLPCCVWGAEGLSAGNVFETPLSELWASPGVQKQREGLYKKGCTEGCFNHSLYEFTTSTGESFRVS
jgi:MoaA/NifB/PqqE/SkfB family radical SAM enzyme